jgi:phospholipid/cholesterol/gamma-HCH transport system substrate-binding protein
MTATRIPTRTRTRTRPRPRRDGRSPFAVGLIALVVIAILVFLGFTKDIPFTRPFQVKAVFTSSNGLRPDSPVRIAGVEVGKVKRVDAQDGTDNAVVTMSIDKSGLPLHRDATAKIRPRIFLEGNFFVDLAPGTPGAPELGDGDTLRVTQTSTPVQLDQVLTALQSDTRQDLRDVLEGLGTALRSKPSAADDRDADPSARGETAAKSFNDAYDDIGPAERAQSQVNEALLGLEPEQDLSRLIEGAGRTAAGLVRNETQLKELVSNFNTTMAALASEDTNLRASIRELAPTLENANGALASLNEAFPPTRAFAREILPGVRETPATIAASFPWVDHPRARMSRPELQGLARDLSPATRDLARLTDQAIALLPQTDLASKCATRVVLPTGNVVIHDEFETGRENYKDFFYAMVGLAGEGENFDGNGSYVRFQTGGGSQQVSLGQSSAGSPPQFGGLPTPPLGNRPFYPGKVPPYRSDQPCYTQKPPNLNGPAAAKRPPSNAGATAARTTSARAAKLSRLRSKIRPFGTREGAR